MLDLPQRGAARRSARSRRRRGRCRRSSLRRSRSSARSRRIVTDSETLHRRPESRARTCAPARPARRAFVDQIHHDRGRPDLGDRPDLEQRVGRRSTPVSRLRQPDAAAPTWPSLRTASDAPDAVLSRSWSSRSLESRAIDSRRQAVPPVCRGQGTRVARRAVAALLGPSCGPPRCRPAGSDPH